MVHDYIVTDVLSFKCIVATYEICIRMSWVRIWKTMQDKFEDTFTVYDYAFGILDLRFMITPLVS
jgi:hypothetical protein